MPEHRKTICEEAIPDFSMKRWRCAWLVWNTVFYIVMIPWSVAFAVSWTSYWGGRYYPFEYTPWTDVLWNLRALPIVLLLVVTHIIILINKRKIYSPAIHLLALLLVWFLSQPISKTFTLGFRDYFRDGTVVDEIQVWLGGLDPNECVGGWSRRNSDSLLEPDKADSTSLPTAITTMNPWFVYLGKDGKGHPKIRLKWIFGPEGNYGIEIGSSEMSIPATIQPRKNEHGNWDDGEVRLRVSAGAYVWYQ